jgi:hypothetical protein
MKQANIKIDFAAKKIVLSKRFSEQASKVDTAEYHDLQRVRIDYPDFEVSVKQIRRNENKESYLGLNYAFMEKYIMLQPDAEARMEEYQEKRLISECHSVRFPAIKKWFLETYPEIKNYGSFRKDDIEEKEDVATAA